MQPAMALGMPTPAALVLLWLPKPLQAAWEKGTAKLSACESFTSHGKVAKVDTGWETDAYV